MALFLNTLQSEINRLHQNKVRLRIIGDLSGFSDKLQNHVIEAERLTANNTALTLVIAANYGGRWDIAQAAGRLSRKVVEGQLRPEDITVDHMRNELSLSDLPEPDLFIRTGGEQRISNFLLWQLAYTELYFTDALWPDYDAEALQQAFASFTQRQRRFGRTGEQVEQQENA